MLMAALFAMQGLDIYVDFSDEPRTGADMEWWYVNWPNGPYLRILLQAKRLTGDGKQWNRHSYREIDHKIGNAAGAPFQAQILVREARTSTWPSYPLYIFYQPKRTLDLAGANGTNNLDGIMLADGFEIRHHILTNRYKKNRSFRGFGNILPMLFPLSDLFCPISSRPVPVKNVITLTYYDTSSVDARGFQFPIAPNPSIIKKRLQDRRPKQGRSKDLPPIELGKGLPDHIRQAVELHRRGDYDSFAAKPKRHRVIFIGRDDESQG
jgi:hypothetical protein